MSLDWLLEPISEEAPCGPDLNVAMDAAFDDYYFGALGRLPERFLKPGVERPDGSRSPDDVLDPKDVDASGEAKQIDALLKQSRDLRLLVLRAQWEILAGRIAPMAQSVRAIADLLDTFGSAVHPTLESGSGERRDTLNDLAQQNTVLLPLQFAGLTGTTEVTLRKLRIAAGQATPLSFEDEISSAMLQDSLAAPTNRKKVDESHGALLSLSQSLARIVATCQVNESHPFSPALDPLQDLVTECLEAITDARADLRGAEIDAPPPRPAAEEPGQPEPVAPTAAAPQASDGQSRLQVDSHQEARQVLEACEAYYRHNEPSSAALLLVTQARVLIGRPLIEALETLLPQEAAKAIVEFGPQTGFVMNIDRLRALSSDGAGQSPEPAAESPSAPAPVIETSADAVDALRGVESFFRSYEKSSPVPLLLQRARSYADKDFRALVEELIPQPRQGESG